MKLIIWSPISFPHLIVLNQMWGSIPHLGPYIFRAFLKNLWFMVYENSSFIILQNKTDQMNLTASKKKPARTSSLYFFKAMIIDGFTHPFLDVPYVVSWHLTWMTFKSFIFWCCLVTNTIKQPHKLCKSNISGRCTIFCYKLHVNKQSLTKCSI